VVTGKLPDHLFLDVTKPSFTLALKVLSYRAAQTLFDRMIRINERKLETPRQLATDCGFTRAGQAY
jgi:hypothetical protein